MKRIVFLIIFLNLFTATHSQIANNWVFGYGSGLNFTYTPPKYFTDSISGRFCNSTSQDTFSSAASNSISNCDGNLLFYTNGRVVWNKNHLRIPNYCLNDSLNIVSVYSSKTKILKQIGNDSLYYIFYSTIYWGLRYAIININLDGGRGDIISNHNMINNYTNIYTPEIIKHANDTDYWLICKPNATQIFSYRITSLGVSQTPVISSASGSFSNLFPLKASLSGNFILYFDKASNGYLGSGYCCTFNKGTGLVSNIKTIFNNTSFPSSNNILQGVEFSPNDSFLYTSTSVPPINYARITQFKRYLPNPVIFPIELAFIPNRQSEGIQLAPDGKVYLSNASASFLSCITRPDEISFGCNYIYNYLDISSDKGAGGFPSVYFQLRRL